jgi:hypothetical protein
LHYSTFEEKKKGSTGVGSLTVYNQFNKPEGVAKQLYFKRVRIRHSDAHVPSRPLSSFPSTLVGEYIGVEKFDVYLVNLNWEKEAATPQNFDAQRARDITAAYCEQLLSHFEMNVHPGALNMPVRR